jgi:hypothetical protein
VAIDFKVRKPAIVLKDILLDKVEADRNVYLAYNDLSLILDAAIDGSIEIPLSQIPQNYDFHEGNLRKYPDLEDAFSKFSYLAKNLRIK